VRAACGGRGGIGGVGGLGTGTDIVGRIWLTLRAPPLTVIGRTEFIADMGGFGTAMPVEVALPPNSNTAGRVGGCALLPTRLISAVPPGLDSVKPAFLSAGLNVVSSWSIIGAGSAGTAGFGVGIGAGAEALIVLLRLAAGCFDQPMSERVVGLGSDGAICAWIFGLKVDSDSIF